LEEFEENWEMPLAESWVGELLQNWKIISVSFKNIIFTYSLI